MSHWDGGYVPEHNSHQPHVRNDCLHCAYEAGCHMAQRALGACEICWTQSWTPVRTKIECVLNHPHPGEHLRCEFCWQAQAAAQQLRDAAAALERARNEISQLQEQVDLQVSHEAFQDMKAELEKYKDELAGLLHPEFGTVWRTEAELARMKAVLQKVTEQAPRVLAAFKQHNIVFKRAPSVPVDQWGALSDGARWEHIAFSLYTNLVELATEAEWALEDMQS